MIWVDSRKREVVVFLYFFVVITVVVWYPLVHSLLGHLYLAAGLCGCLPALYFFIMSEGS